MKDTELTTEEIPKIPLDTDGLIVRLSKLHRDQILGLADGRKHFIPAIAEREGTKMIFIVGLEEAMPSNEESRRIKQHGILFGLPVNEEDIKLLDSRGVDYISFNIINTRNNNQLAFMVEVRRMEDLKK